MPFTFRTPASPSKVSTSGVRPSTRLERTGLSSLKRGAAIRQHWELIPTDTDVLITHEAPYGTLDKSHILAKHRGCQNLTASLLRVRPKLHVFGHIHGGYGKEFAWGTTLVNCAVVDNARVLTNPPTVVELARRSQTF
jgi:Icc-related predicted phosphoesterase